MATIGAHRRPGWQYWLIAALALLWNAFGCLDFAMTASRNPDYLAHVSPEALNWLDTQPAWSIIPWALGVFGGLLGAMLLLVRSPLAVVAFWVSLAGLVVSQVRQFSSNMPESMMTPPMMAMTAMIWIVAIGLLWFAWIKRRSGVLH